jgi:pimeloyl-ACP methyl ester carboxylesterase
MTVAGETAVGETVAGEAGWTDGWYWSADGLRLHWRELPGPEGRPTLLCIPGLTRTARDFEVLGNRLAGQWRLVAVDLRGRGDSAWPKDSLSYLPLTYMGDLHLLLEAAGIERFIVLGNSVGGQLAMQMAMAHRASMAGAILNDIGPDVEPAGLARMRTNVGRAGNWPTWVHAARDLAVRNAGRYPGWGLGDWLAFAKNLCRLGPSGRITFDYDPRIAEPFRLPHGDAGLDLWVALAALRDIPVLSIRGERSDVLSRATQARMATILPGLRMALVPGIGHAPSLAEPAAAAAIDALLAAVLAAGR